VSTVQSSPFVRAARFLGDFGNPFYEEERHRDVWNEASAFGFQLALVTALLFSTVCIWLVGRPALPYVQAGVLLTGAISWATILYAQRLGVDVTHPQRLRRARMVPFTLLAVVLIAGMLRVSGAGSSWEAATSWDAATAAGAVTGAALVLALVALTTWAARRAAARGEQAD
jgi:hypothetical protein